MKELSETGGARVAPYTICEEQSMATTAAENKKTEEPSTRMVTPSFGDDAKSSMHNQLKVTICQNEELSQFILRQLEVGESKAAVLIRALEMSSSMKTPLHSDEVLRMVEQMAENLDHGMTEDCLINKILSQLIPQLSQQTICQ